MILHSPKLINIVLDLETVSTKPDAGILQIGAAIPEFEQYKLNGLVSPTFESTISYNELLIYFEANQVDMSDSTMGWWDKQDPDTKRQVFSGQTSYDDALAAFVTWVKDIKAVTDCEVAIWGNDVGFDNVILTHSLDMCGHHNVWSYKNNRCFRTINALFPTDTSDLVNTAKHTALGDAIYEAEILNRIDAFYGN